MGGFPRDTSHGEDARDRSLTFTPKRDMRHIVVRHNAGSGHWTGVLEGRASVEMIHLDRKCRNPDDCRLFAFAT